MVVYQLSVTRLLIILKQRNVLLLKYFVIRITRDKEVNFTINRVSTLLILINTSFFNRFKKHQALRCAAGHNYSHLHEDQDDWDVVFQMTDPLMDERHVTEGIL